MDGIEIIAREKAESSISLDFPLAKQMARMLLNISPVKGIGICWVGGRTKIRKIAQSGKGLERLSGFPLGAKTEETPST
jgi:nitroreductase